MPYAVAMLLDPASSRTVTGIWSKLAEMNISESCIRANFRPHVSLGIAEQIDLDPLRDYLDRFCNDQSSFPITLSSFGIFPGKTSGALFFGVTPTPVLLNIHEAFHQFLSEYARNLRPYYLPGLWVPHCTLADGVACENAPRAIEICQSTTLPIHCMIREIAVFEFPPGRELLVYPLRSTAD